MRERCRPTPTTSPMTTPPLPPLWSNGCRRISSHWQPVAGALRQPASDASTGCSTRRACSSCGSTPTRSLREARQTLLENQTGHGISTGNGVVTLDPDQLGRAGVQTVRVLSSVLLVVVLLLCGVAIYLTRGARPRNRSRRRLRGHAARTDRARRAPDWPAMWRWTPSPLRSPTMPAGRVWLIASSILADIGRADYSGARARSTRSPR